MVLKLLIHVEDGERLGVEAGEEHIHHEQNVELLGLLAFDAIRDVLVVGGEGVRGEVRAVAGVVVADDALQGVAAQLVLALGVLVRAVGEYRADGEVVVDRLEEVVVADERRDGRDGEDGRVLAVARPRLVVADDVVCDERQPLVRAVHLLRVDPLDERAVLLLVVALDRLDVLDVEAEDVVVENGVLDEVVVQALAEKRLGGEDAMPLRHAVHLEAGRPGEAEELRVCEMPDNVAVHVAELAAVAFVDDEYDFLVLVGVHHLRVPRSLDGDCHLLHRRDDELAALVLHLADENVRLVRRIHGTLLELVELLGGLRIEVFAVNKENDLLDLRAGGENLSRLERGERLARAGRVPDVGVLRGERRLPHECFHGIDLIRTHHQQNPVRVVQDHVARKHLHDVVAGKERLGKVLQVREADVLPVSPEERQRVEKLPVGVGEILCVHAVGHDENLDVVEQPSIGVLLVAHDLVDGLADVDSAPLQLDLHEREAVHEDGHVVAVLVLADDCGLVRDLKDVLRGVVGIEEREVRLCAVVAFEYELVAQHLRALEDGLALEEVEHPLPFLVGERLVELVLVERLELRHEVRLQRVLVGNGDRSELLPAQLRYELLLKLRFALICHTPSPRLNAPFPCQNLARPTLAHSPRCRRCCIAAIRKCVQGHSRRRTRLWTSWRSWRGQCRSPRAGMRESCLCQSRVSKVSCSTMPYRFQYLLRVIGDYYSIYAPKTQC